MLPGRNARRGHVFRYFQSARFLPFSVLVSATKSLSLSIDFSPLFLCKRRSGRLKQRSGSEDDLLAGVGGLAVRFALHAPLEPALDVPEVKLMLRRLCVRSVCAARCRRFSSTRSRLG